MTTHGQIASHKEVAIGSNGAYADQGDVTWTYANNGSQVVISGVLIEGWAAIGFDPNLTITVPSLYGHYTGTIGTFLTLMPGNPQLTPKVACHSCKSHRNSCKWAG